MKAQRKILPTANFWIAATVCAATVGLPRLADAGSPGTQSAAVAKAPSPATSPLNDGKHHSCGPRCTYMLSGQIESEAVRDQVNVALEVASATSMKDFNQLTNHFCADIRDENTDDDKLKACKQEWLFGQSAMLRRAGVNIQLNDSHATELLDKKAYVDGEVDLASPRLERYASGDTSPKKPIIMTMPKADAMLQQTSDRVKIENPPMTKTQCMNWATRALNIDENEFMSKRYIYKDPDHPDKKQTYAIIQTNADGSIKYDVAAFTAELDKRKNFKMTKEARERFNQACERYIDPNGGAGSYRNMSDQQSDLRVKAYAETRADIHQVVSDAVRAEGLTDTSGRAPSGKAGLQQAATAKGGVSSNLNPVGSQASDQVPDVPANAQNDRAFISVNYNDEVLGQEIDQITSDALKN